MQTVCKVRHTVYVWSLCIYLGQISTLGSNSIGLPCALCLIERLAVTITVYKMFYGHTVYEFVVVICAQPKTLAGAQSNKDFTKE